MKHLEQLIGEHIDESLGTAEARLKKYGVSVWAIVGHLEGVSGDMQQVAADYDVPEEAIQAAERYYRKHKRLIDARRAMNAV